MKKNSLMGRLICYDVLMPIILILFVTSFIINVYDLPRIAKRMPLIVGSITLFFLAIEAFNSISKVIKADKLAEDISKSFKFYGNKAFQFVLIMIFYGLGIYFFGYFIPTCIMLLITMRLIGEKSILKIFLVSGGFLLLFYLTFIVIFGLYMPKGVLL